tara:strand:- start:3790 stop:4977 length:1188 start_codon:yes stop_codon:yes gene_type:complete
MRLLDKYIIYSSIFALFSEDFYFHYGIDVKLFYLILISNFLLLSINKKITVPKNLLIILGFFIGHGIISYLWLQNPIKSLFAQVLGISLSSIYYYNFIKNYGVKKVFNVYLNFAFFIALIAIPMFYFQINSFSEFRLNGILTEPAHYAAIMLPATYVFLKDKKYLKLGLMVITIFLSKSSIGYIGLGLILILPLLKTKYFVKYAWIVFVIIGSSAYYLSTQWNKPVDENTSNVLVRRLKETNKSLGAVSTGKFEKQTNLSSYAFLSNSFITKKIVLNKPFGTGLGSYQYEYDKYYPLIKPPPYLVELKQSKINRTDANSLFLRMLADLGIFAVIIFIYIGYRSYQVFRSEKKIMQQSTFFYLLVKLIREGHYFPPEFYFFLLIFLKDFDEDITHS